MEMNWVEENRIGVVADGYGRILRQFVRCTYNPSRRQYEAKGDTRDHVLSFRTKSEAQLRATRMGIPKENVVRYGNALDTAYAIQLTVHSPELLIAIFE
jgi:hypothetical protein